MRVIDICLLIFVILSGVSCSSHSLKKSMLYSFVGGAVVGGGTAYMAAPEGKKNKISNGLLFGATSGLIAAGMSYLFYKNDPTKSPLERRILPDEIDLKRQIRDDENPIYELNLGSNNIRAQLKFEQKSSYKQHVQNLSPELQKIFPTPYIKVHKIEDQIIKTGKETILMRGCEAVIQTIEGPSDERE